MQRSYGIYMATALALGLAIILFGPARALSAIPVVPTADDPVFVGAGDIADCNLPNDSNTADLLDGITGTVFTLGDNAYSNGTINDYNNCYEPTWGRHKARTKPVPGNHEYNSGGGGYYTYFGTAASPQENNCTVNCKGYYSYDLGTWHIIALNSEIDHTANSAQVTWLTADLAAHANTCTLAYWHKPYYSSGEHGNDTSFKPFWDALYAVGADVVLTGHDHNYERFAPQNPAAQAEPTRGIREFVVGTGGAAFRGFPTIRANSEVRNSDTWGVLKLTLHAASYDWQFMPIAGQNFTDTGTTNCVSLVSPIVSLTPFQSTVNEGDGNVTLTVQLSVSTTVPITVNYSTSFPPFPGPEDATPGSDYVTATNQSLVVPAGQLSATLAIPIINDSIIEQSERFSVTVALPAGSIATLDAVNITATVTITDNDGVSNTPPVANSQTVNAVKAITQTITLTGSDVDGDPLNYTLITQPISGTLSGSAPNLIYTPNDGFVGTDSFSFKVNDGIADSPTVTVTLVVAATSPVGNNKLYLPAVAR